MGSDLDDEFFELYKEKTPEEIQQELFELLAAESDLEIADDRVKENSDWSALFEKFSEGSVTVDYAFGFVPFRAEGTILGMPFHYRERYGEAKLKVYAVDSDPSVDSNPLYSSSVKVPVGRGGIGWMDTFVRLVRNLKKAPYSYRFLCNQVRFREGVKISVDSMYDTGQKEYIRGFGISPEDAYENTKEIDRSLFDYGWTENIQKAMWKLRNVIPEPVTKDVRKFPDKDPDFNNLLISDD